MIARVLADHYQQTFKQPFNVVNRPGAGANIGAQIVAASDPDGHSLLIAPPGPHVVNQYLYPSLPFDPEHAFAPITLVARFPNVLVVHPSLGVNSIAQLIDRAKAMPGKLDYATAGTGATSHLATALFMAMVGIEMNHVPYKGTSQSIQDVVAGRVPVTLDNLGPILPFIRSGQLIALGVSTRTPLSLLPNVPPIASVAPGYEASSWNALTAPAATPTAIIAKLSGEANRILRRPEVIEQLRTFGSEAAGGTPEETAQFLLAERVRWKRAVDAAKVKP